MNYSKTPLIRVSGDQFKRFELGGLKIKGIKFNYFKPLRNGQKIRIKQEFELSGLRNRGVLLYIYLGGINVDISVLSLFPSKANGKREGLQNL